MNKLINRLRAINAIRCHKSVNLSEAKASFKELQVLEGQIEINQVPITKEQVEDFMNLNPLVTAKEIDEFLI